MFAATHALDFAKRNPPVFIQALVNVFFFQHEQVVQTERFDAKARHYSAVIARLPQHRFRNLVLLVNPAEKPACKTIAGARQIDDVLERKGWKRKDLAAVKQQPAEIGRASCRER